MLVFMSTKRKKINRCKPTFFVLQMASESRSLNKKYGLMEPRLRQLNHYIEETNILKILSRAKLGQRRIMEAIN